MSIKSSNGNGGGAEGPQGPQGPQGIPGNDGADGAQGPQGIQGEQGPAGADGSGGGDLTIDSLKLIKEAQTISTIGNSLVFTFDPNTPNVRWSGSSDSSLGGISITNFPKRTDGVNQVVELFNDSSQRTLTIRNFAGNGVNILSIATPGGQPLTLQPRSGVKLELRPAINAWIVKSMSNPAPAAAPFSPRFSLVDGSGITKTQPFGVDLFTFTNAGKGTEAISFYYRVPDTYQTADKIEMDYSFLPADGTTGTIGFRVEARRARDTDPIDVAFFVQTFTDQQVNNPGAKEVTRATMDLTSFNGRINNNGIDPGDYIKFTITRIPTDSYPGTVYFIDDAVVY